MLIDTLHYFVTLQMTVTDLSLNRHEKELLSAIEDTMPDGIHVQGIIRKIKMSPTTVNHYLPILENDHKLVYHEKIKNKNIYKIKILNEKSFAEQSKSYTKLISELEKEIKNSIQFANRSSLVQQLEIYGYITNILALTRYMQSFEVLDDDPDSIPQEYLEHIKKVEQLSIVVRKSMNSKIHPLHLLMIDKSISSSRKFLKEMTRKKIPKSTK